MWDFGECHRLAGSPVVAAASPDCQLTVAGTSFADACAVVVGYVDAAAVVAADVAVAVAESGAWSRVFHKCSPSAVATDSEHSDFANAKIAPVADAVAAAVAAEDVAAAAAVVERLSWDTDSELAPKVPVSAQFHD